MIAIKDKALCSGCAACVNICPIDVISMREDEEGFLYPLTNINRCAKCSKCVKACPYTSSTFTMKADSEELSKCYAAYNKNEEIRLKSSSGGIFRVLADKIISENGVVFGAAFDEKFEVYHAYASASKDVEKFMGSKYLQSRIGTVYREVKENLKDGKKVLFSGVACQIAGLKHYLKIENENLICVDLICYSVGSPKIWREYLRNFFPDCKIYLINFRDKTSGWIASSTQINTNKQNYSCYTTENLYFKSLKSNVFCRPACGTCKFKNKNRVSDITLADCWGFQAIAPEMNDNKGLSSIIVHTEKGANILNTVRDQLAIKETSLADVEKFNSNYALPESFDKTKRDNFWKDYNKMPFKKLIAKYANGNRKKIILNSIKRIVKKAMPKFAWKSVKLFASIIKIPSAYKIAKREISLDKKFNETFRFNGKKMPRWFKRKPEWKIIVLYRKYQANNNNILGKYYKYKLNRQGSMAGIDFEGNLSIGKGLIIGHYGRIIINGETKFGEQIYLTHGVTIGRNSAGKRKGVPTIGSRVRIGANAVIIGNIEIGNDVVIAPGAFVNFDVPSHSVVIGNPGQIHSKENATDGYLGTL